jgi:hypothetical protein
MKMLRLMLLLAVFYAAWVSTIWYDYPFSDYGFGLNLVRTKAEILTSGVRERERHLNSRRTLYEPAISFKYEVNGTTYISSKFSISGDASSKHEALQLAGRYKPGAIELAYFSPTNPKFALLKKDFPWHYLGVTVFFAVIAGFIFVAGMVFIVQDEDKKIYRASRKKMSVRP